MKRNRKIKILATLGPKTATEEMIEKLFLAGADCFRINFSHTKHEDAQEVYDRIRRVEEKHGRPIGILADMQGPKLRVGEFKDGKIELKEGQSFVFDTDKTPGDTTRVHLPHQVIFDGAKEGDTIILDDGKMRMRVTSAGKDRIETEVMLNGTLADRKGVSLPDTELSIGALTEKDRKDLEFAANMGADWIALSFVQRPDDVAEARKLAAGRSAIMSKIEKPQAVNRLDDIIEVSDGLMVARGDLGVEFPLPKVPGVQKRMTRAARRAGKPVVVATQMLESMIDSPVPTRAEVSDVATAVFEGADAIMLSAESAVGRFPVEAVSMMDEIAIEVETDPHFRGIIYAQRTEPEATSPDAISASSLLTADTLNAAAIVTYTSSGSTGIRASRERPQQRIIALTPRVKTGRKLAIAWGLHCVLTGDATDENDMVRRACRIVREEGFADMHDRIVITAGVPFGTPGATNLMRIAFVSDGFQRSNDGLTFD